MDASISSYADVAMMQANAPDINSTLAGGMANIDKTAQDFEGMFMTQMLQPMFEGIKADPIFGGGNGEEIMQSFMLQEYGKLIAKSGSLGIANMVKSEMIRAQQDQAKKSTPDAGGLYAAHQ